MLMLEQQDYCNMDMCMELDALGCPIAKHDTINLYTKERNTVYGKFTLYEAQKWLRKKKGLFVEAVPSNELSETDRIQYIFNVYDLKNKRILFLDKEIKYDWYEESLTAGINECIKLLKKYELESDNIF